MATGIRSDGLIRHLILFLLVSALLPLLGAFPALAQTDLTVLLSAGGSEPVAAGEEFSYYVFAANAGPNPATGVNVTVTLPASVTYLASEAGCAFAAPTLTCAIGGFSAGATRTLRVLIRVNPDAALPAGGASLAVTAAIDGVEADPVAANDSASLTTLVTERADLRITVVAPTGTVPAGAIFQYSILVDNYGPSVARDVQIRDTLFAGVANSIDTLSIQSCAFSVSQGQGAITQFTCTTGPIVGTQFGSDIGIFSTDELWPEGDIGGTMVAPGRLRASFRLVAAMGLTPYNTATVGAGTPDPDPTNNMDDAVIEVVPSADLQAFAVFSAEVQVNGLPGLTLDTNALPALPDPACCIFGGTTVTAGRRIQWDSSTTIAGPSAAHNAWIEVLLPAGTSLIENTLNGNPNPGPTVAAGRCLTEPAGEQRRKVVCRYGTLEPTDLTDGNEEINLASLRFQVLVDPTLPPGTQLSFDARTGADEADPNDSNNITGVQFDTDAWADQAVDIADIPGAQTWSAGDLNVFEVRVENRGPSLERAAALRIDLPAAFDFEGASAMYAGVLAAGPTLPGALPCQELSATEVLCPLGDLDSTTVAGLGAVPLRVFVSGRVRPGTPAPTTLTATATAVGATRDPLAANDAGSEDVDTDAGPPAGTADLGIAMTADPAPQFSPGQEVAYAIEVTNNGPAFASNVVVVDALPEAIVPTAADPGPGPGSCLVAAEVTCALGGMASGDVRTILVRGYVKRRLASRARVANAASVASDTPDAVPENNNATVISELKIRNVIANSSFEVPTISPPWQQLLTDPGDGQDCAVAHDGSCSYRIVGVPGVEKRLRQNIVFNGKKGDRIDVTAFSKAVGVSGSGSYRLELRGYLANGWRTIATRSFAAGTHGWQQRSISFAAPWNFRALAVVAKFRKMAGTAWFDDVRLKVHPGTMP